MRKCHWSSNVLHISSIYSFPKAFFRKSAIVLMQGTVLAYKKAYILIISIKTRCIKKHTCLKSTGVHHPQVLDIVISTEKPRPANTTPSSRRNHPKITAKKRRIPRKHRPEAIRPISIQPQLAPQIRPAPNQTNSR